jgi:His-Xaa-Ser system protein HxsD
MEAIREGVVHPMALSIGHSLMALEVDSSLYELDAIYRAAYRFTDRCYIFLARIPETPELVSVTLMGKQPAADLRPLVGELCNELIDQQIRLALAREAGPLRELIVAQAFSEGNLLDEQRDHGDFESDPLGIGRGR